MKLQWMWIFLSLALCLPDIVPASSEKKNDGSTVTAMLARIGLGPLSRCYKVGGAVEHEGPCLQLGLEKNLPECWGYEKNCSREKSLFVPHCDPPAQPWSRSMEDKHMLFWNQGDFGYVKQEVDSMMALCMPKQKGDSSLLCSTNLRYCRAHHLYVDFRRFDEITKMEGQYKSFLEDIFKEGELGGHCELNKELLRRQSAHKSPLQSWFAELAAYTSLKFKATSKYRCDEIVTRPTVFIKLDAGVNLYHHYCDYFNLFASQHINGSFDDDINIVIWDTSYKPYFDLFAETWKAFTRHPVMRLSDFQGKRMCFRDAMFPLLARMRGGLYYNTYVVPGCQGSGLMQAFTKHLLTRLGVVQEPSEPDIVRVTVLSRSTKHRRIVNEDELVRAMKTINFFDVRVVDYKHKVYPFLDQLKSSHNSDIFMGMHGSGLTHLLFLPDWGGAFEIYNTEDPKCYHDLARLRGIPYITWEEGSKVWPESEGKHPTLGTHHAKFTNYSFDVTEFIRMTLSLGEKVLQRKKDAFATFHNIKLNSSDRNEL